MASVKAGSRLPAVRHRLMLQFHRRERRAVKALTLFPGAFNPPTRAHLAMAQSALEFSDEAVFVLPREFPHKEYAGPDFEQRLEMLLGATARHAAFSVASCERGLFIDIARAARAAGETQPRLLLLCGADAAERILEWDYGEADAIERQLEEFELLVAPRLREYVPRSALATRVQSMAVSQEFQEMSSTAIRLEVARGSKWRDWVPDEIAALVERYYS